MTFPPQIIDHAHPANFFARNDQSFCMEMEKIKKQATFVRRYRFFFFFEIQERNSRLLGKIRVVQILTESEIRNQK